MGPRTRSTIMKPKKREKRTKQHCLTSPQPYPWLLYFNGNGIKDQIFCSISNPTKPYFRSIPELRDSRLWSIQHGWCVLANKVQDATYELSLWNPSNLNKINLPRLKHNGIQDIILSSSPTATDQVCSIFLFSARFAPTSVFYCQLGDEQWTEVDYSAELSVQLNENQFHLINPVYCNNCLYTECDPKNFLVVIEKLQPHDLKINSTGVTLPTLWGHNSFDSIRKLLESNNQLFRIEIMHAQNKVIAVLVHRLDFSRMVWEKVQSINDRVFFISNLGLPFSWQAINSEAEGGCIYFTLEGNNFVHIYNIENNSLNKSLPFSNLPNKRSSPWWFMPDIRMTGFLKEEEGHTQPGSVDVYSNSKEMADDEVRSRVISGQFALPLDMVGKVANHINRIDDLLHFRATSRLFRVAAPLSLLSRLSMSPLFVYFEKDSVLTMEHPKYKYKFNIDFPEDFQSNCEICYSKGGWLLMAVNTVSNIFFNPLTREVKQLAYGPNTIRNTRCVGFSHPPTSSECVVVELSKITTHPPGMAVWGIKLGMELWDHCVYEDSDFPLSNMSPAYYNGVFYYISQKGNLGVLEVGEGRFRWEVFDEPNAPCTGYYNNFLVECNGSLLSIFEGLRWVRVFKLDEFTMTWIEVVSLGNHMLFVGNTSLSAVADIPGMENKIYFPRFYEQDIVFYSLDTNKYHTFKNVEVNFHHVTEPLSSSWIEQK